MPQPYEPRIGAKIATGFKVLLDRRDCATRIAMVAAASAELEEALAFMLSQATSTNFRVWESQEIDGGIEFQASLNMVARATMDALESWSARISVAAAALSVTASSEMCRRFEEQAPSLRRAAGMRADVVHTRWCTSDAYPEDLLKPLVGAGKYLRYTVADFDSIIERIGTEADKIRHLSTACFMERVEAQRKENLLSGPPPGSR